MMMAVLLTSGCLVSYTIAAEATKPESDPAHRGKRTLDAQLKELIAIGASVGAHCQPCLSYHVGKAKEIGLAEDEIRQAIAVGHMVEKGAMSAMRQFSAGIFEADKKSL